MSAVTSNAAIVHLRNGRRALLLQLMRYLRSTRTNCAERCLWMSRLASEWVACDFMRPIWVSTPRLGTKWQRHASRFLAVQNDGADQNSFSQVVADDGLFLQEVNTLGSAACSLLFALLANLNFPKYNANSIKYGDWNQLSHKLYNAVVG